MDGAGSMNHWLLPLKMDFVLSRWSWGIIVKIIIPACDEGPGLCAFLITLLSCLLIIVSLPLSLCCVIKVVQVSWLSLGTDDLCYCFFDLITFPNPESRNISYSDVLHFDQSQTMKSTLPLSGFDTFSGKVLPLPFCHSHISGIRTCSDFPAWKITFRWRQRTRFASIVNYQNYQIIIRFAFILSRCCLDSNMATSTDHVTWRCLLHHPLRWHLWEDRHAHPDIWCSPPRGDKRVIS